MSDFPRLRFPQKPTMPHTKCCRTMDYLPGGSDRGPRLGEFDGRDYDPLRDYACDRTEAASIWMFTCGTISEQRNHKR